MLASSLLLPVRCAVCGRDGEPLCRECNQKLRRLGPPACERCGAPTAWAVERCRECAAGGSRSLERGRRLPTTTLRNGSSGAWKERGQRTLAELAAEVVDGVVPRPSAYTITFVPADHDRLLQRGHNPAHRLAAELGARWQLPVVPLLAAHPGGRPRKA